MARIVVAGATGKLGGMIVGELRKRGAEVVGLVRPGTARERLDRLTAAGAAVAAVEIQDGEPLRRALAGADAVVSALQGLRDVIVDAQAELLNAAVAAGVRRFIPSDFAADFTKLERGENRNFDFRLEFRDRLLAAPIRSTSILNGAFMELLHYGSAFIDRENGAINHWGSADQTYDFTTMADTAAVTAEVALDAEAPAIVRLAGDRVTPRDLAVVAGDVFGRPFDPLRLGTIAELAALIARQRADHPEAEAETFPRYVQLQYMHNMQSGRAALDPLGNARFSNLRFTTVRDLFSR